ncbi:MAG TPA: hypothetical protein VJX67_06540 [Blastocatellia bacterium]|nr:hypothetical protein [Blastocatellia bacterium]
MSIASDYNGYDADDCAIDLDTWEMHFQEVLEKDPELAEGLTRVLFYLLDAIESGPKGVAQAKNSLKEGIAWAYTYTQAHKAALKLFLLYVEGRLTVPDEPQRLIAGAVARGIEDAEKSRTRKRP